MAYSRKANWAARRAVSVALRYGLAVVSVAVALLLTSVWLRYSDSPLPFTGFALSAIGITFWKARTIPGLLAAFLATLVRSYFFAPATTVIARMLYDSLFLFFGLLMIWITRSRNELEERVAERTAELIAVNDKLKVEIAERKLADVELRLIIDTIPIIVWRKFADGSADLLNQEFRKYTGLSEEEGLGWSWINVFHPDDRLTEEWHADFAAGKPFEKEARLRRADGEYRWFLVRAVPIKGDRGELVKWFGLSIDVDDLKKAEDRIRLIINTIPTLAWSLRPDGIVDFVNQRWLEYTGLTLEHELAEPTRPVHPEDLARVMEKWRADMAAGQPSEDEIRLQRADRAYRWFLVRTAPLRDERGNVVKWFGISIDIDDRKRVESQIRLLLDAIPQQIWSGPPDGTLDYCNARLRSYMGIGLDELQGNVWPRILHPDDRDRVLKAWHESVTDGTPYEQEERHRRADGQYRWFLSRGLPMRDAEGCIVRWYGTNTDIEERKRAEETLRSSEREQRHVAAQLERERARLVEAQTVAKMGSWEVELQSLDVIWSEQTHRIFETDPARFHPTRPRFLEFIHPEDRAKVDAALVTSVDRRSPGTVEYRIVMPDGRVKILEERWQVFLDGQGTPVRLAGTCRDITERVQAEEDLQRLSGRLLQSQDEERRRIARELHDSMGQNLVALATDLAHLRTSVPSSARKLRESASRCEQLANECVREVRTLSYLMYPPLLDESGLADAVRHFVDGFTTRTGIKVELKVNPMFGRMRKDVELALFRVVQESLTNVHRHSGSPGAKIVLDCGPGHVTVEVSDMGRGTSGKRPGTRGTPFQIGVGISSMIERVKLVAGRLDIIPGPGGTTVRATVPGEPDSNG
jgi:PAS domain S-box-containing protein